MTLTVEHLAKLPPDAIAQVVNAYRDALTESTPHGLAYKHEAAAQAFRDALASMLPRLEDAAPEPSERTIHVSEKLRRLAERLRESGLDWDGASVCEEGAEMIEAQGLVISDLEQDADARLASRAPGAPENTVLQDTVDGLLDADLNDLREHLVGATSAEEVRAFLKALLIGPPGMRAASSDDRALRDLLTAASELVFASIGETTYGSHGAQRAVSVHYTDEQFKRLMTARTALAHLIESHGAALAGAAPSAPPP